MALRLEIVSQHRTGLGSRAVKEFGRDGGTIGRSLESDWVLPDSQRFLSNRHASIDFRSGSYYIVDTSRNGVYVNGAERAVGRGKPQRLFSGDRIRIGEYEMLAHIDDTDDPNAQLAACQRRDPVDLAQLVPPPEPAGEDLVDPFEMTGVGFQDYLSDDADNIRTLPHGEIELRLEDDGHDRAAGPAAAKRTPRRSPPPVSAAAFLKQPSTPTPAPAPAPTPTPSAAPAADRRSVDKPGEDLTQATPLDAFFRGAGIERQALDERQAAEVMHRAGQLIRELIVGITESLHIRAEQKAALRLPNTTIQRRSNNPLKFSASVDEAMHKLFFQSSGEYLSSVEAVREALRDIKTHQKIMLAALPAAIADYIGRLDPDDLEDKFSGNAKRGSLLNAAGRLRYWDMYRDLYQVVAQHAPGQLPVQFVEELARAYELEAARTATPRDNRRAHSG